MQYNIEKLQEFNKLPRVRKLKILRIYGRTHEKENYPDPLDQIRIPFSFRQQDRVRPEFQCDSLHYKIRQEESQIEKLRQECMSEIENNTLPSTKKHLE